MQNTKRTMQLSRRALVCGAVCYALPLPTRAAAFDPSRAMLLTDVSEDIKPQTDITKTLNRALQLAQERKIGEVVLPAGEYLVQSIALHSRVKLKGLGRGSTRLKAMPGNEGPFITLGNGPILHTAIEGMTLVGGTPAAATNPSQWAIDLEAKPVPGSKPANGGLWWSFIQDVQIIGFSKGIRLQGGAVPGNYQLPHQFLSFRDFVVFLSKDATGPALKLAGQVAQLSFDQCHFDHNGGIGDITLIEIGKVGESQSANGPEPTLVRFNVCTFQSVRQAVEIAGGQNISFASCWFEQLFAGIRVTDNSVGVTIEDCRFANAARNRPAIEFEGKSHGSISSNVFAGAQTKVSIRVAPECKVAQSNNIQTLGAGE